MASVFCFQVFPLYHQVEIRDAADDVDRPLWETGEEEIEVRLDAGRDDRVGGELLFDGELLTTGQGILVGNSLTDLHHVGLPIGWHPIRIYAEPPSNPARFTVLLEVRPVGG